MSIAFHTQMDVEWQYLMQYVFDNDEEATAGFMGNLYAESACYSLCLQGHGSDSVAVAYTDAVNDGTKSKYTFSHDGTGYGLAQWTSPYIRKEDLYDYCANTQLQFDISDLYAQLGYIQWEIRNEHSPNYTSFNNMRTRMLNATGNAQTQIKTCSDLVCDIYERPQYRNYDTRFDYATQIYNHYAGTPVTGNLVTVVVDNPDGPYGTAFSIPQLAEENSQVSLFYRSQEGLTFDGFYSSDVTIRADNTFIMPNAPVVVRALFHGIPTHPSGDDYDIDVKIASNLTDAISVNISQTTAQVGDQITIRLITDMSDDEVAKLDIHANGVQLTITGKLITFYMPAHNVVVVIQRRKKKKLLVARNPQLILLSKRRYQ